MSLQSRAPIHSKSGTNYSMKVTTFVHQLTIDNFSYRNYFRLKSLHFPSSEEFEYQFFLSLDIDTLSCTLVTNSHNKLKSSRKSLKAHFKTSFLDVNGVKQFSKVHHEFSYFLLDDYVNVNIYDLISREVILNPVNQILSNDKLTIYCELSIVEDPVQSAFVPSITDTNSLIESIGSLTIEETVDDLKSLLTSGKLSDIVLVVGGQSIPAHKAILSARSKVFAAMFEYDSKEKQENRVVITDVKAQVFEVLLQFIYTGKITSNVLDQFAEELLAAADKYQLDSLKDICESALCLKLSIESSPSFLVLADMHNAQKLKAKALEFIRNNAYDTIQAVFNSNNPEFAVEAFRDLANKIANKKN